jgi:hypothetical protein
MKTGAAHAEPTFEHLADFNTDSFPRDLIPQTILYLLILYRFPDIPTENKAEPAGEPYTP